MVTVIKKGSPATKVREQIAHLRRSKKKSEIKTLCGTIKLKRDPLVLQKQWRDEWK